MQRLIWCLIFLSLNVLDKNHCFCRNVSTLVRATDMSAAFAIGADW